MFAHKGLALCCTLLTLLVLPCLPALSAPECAHAAEVGPLTLHAAFDNPRVEQSAPGTRYLELLVKAAKTRATSDKTTLPLNIALVIDCSGSMAQDKRLETVKRAALDILDRLTPQDRFALVTYSAEATVRIPAGSVEDLDRARAIIRSLQPDSTTNLDAGLQAGYSEVRKYAQKGKSLNRVFLLSDGLANRGTTDARTLQGAASEEASGGISLSTFGVGLDFNEVLMTSLAECGHGRYYFLEQAENVAGTLAGEFQAAREVVARNVRLTLELDPAVIVEEIFANTFQKEKNRVSIQAGDMSAGESRRVLLRLKAPKMPAGRHAVGTVKLSCRDGNSTRDWQEEQPLALEYGVFGPQLAETLDRAVSERALVFEANQAREEAAKAYDAGDKSRARQILRKSMSALSGAAAAAPMIQQEAQASEAYMEVMEDSNSAEERSRVQKQTRFKRYQLERETVPESTEKR